MVSEAQSESSVCVRIAYARTYAKEAYNYYINYQQNLKLELVEKIGWPTEFIGPFSFVTLNTKMCFFGRLAKILGQLWMNRTGQVFFGKH